MVACRASGYASSVRPLSNRKAKTSEHHLFRAIRNIDTLLEIIVTVRNGRIIATENEIRVLRGPHRFGWLRTRDIATLIWERWQLGPIRQPDLRPVVATASGLRMAQRRLRRLVDARQVLRGQAGFYAWRVNPESRRAN